MYSSSNRVTGSTPLGERRNSKVLSAVVIDDRGLMATGATTDTDNRPRHDVTASTQQPRARNLSSANSLTNDRGNISADHNGKRGRTKACLECRKSKASATAPTQAIYKTDRDRQRRCIHDEDGRIDLAKAAHSRMTPAPTVTATSHLHPWENLDPGLTNGPSLLPLGQPLTLSAQPAVHQEDIKILEETCDQESMDIMVPLENPTNEAEEELQHTIVQPSQQERTPEREQSNIDLHLPNHDLLPSTERRSGVARVDGTDLTNASKCTPTTKETSTKVPRGPGVLAVADVEHPSDEQAEVATAPVADRAQELSKTASPAPEEIRVTMNGTGSSDEVQHVELSAVSPKPSDEPTNTTAATNSGDQSLEVQETGVAETKQHPPTPILMDLKIDDDFRRSTMADLPRLRTAELPTDDHARRSSSSPLSDSAAIETLPAPITPPVKARRPLLQRHLHKRSKRPTDEHKSHAGPPDQRNNEIERLPFCGWHVDGTEEKTHEFAVGEEGGSEERDVDGGDSGGGEPEVGEDVDGRGPRAEAAGLIGRWQYLVPTGKIDAALIIPTSQEFEWHLVGCYLPAWWRARGAFWDGKNTRRASRWR
ncbi:JmjC domain-containing histone demethylation protein 1 [Cryomyces antarcticus]|nr:JmjC domain-containing histone demethylation protein 1 [Cryomyces antarcticus]